MQRYSLRPRKCRNCDKEGHIMVDCPTIICNRCNLQGHIGPKCNHPTYISQRLGRCGCDFRDLTKRNQGDKYDTHCCLCKRYTPLYEMEPSDKKLMARCNECKQRQLRENNKRQLLTPPPSPRPEKLSRQGSPERVPTVREMEKQGVNLQGTGGGTSSMVREKR